MMLIIFVYLYCTDTVVNLVFFFLKSQISSGHSTRA